MEAGKPDRQGRPTRLLAHSLPRFISCCHVAAWLWLLVCVCVAMGVGPQKVVEAIEAGRSHMYSVNVTVAITRYPSAGCDVVCRLAYWTHSNISHGLLSSLLSFCLWMISVSFFSLSPIGRSCLLQS